MFEYEIIRSSRRTLAIQVKNGRVIVRAPQRMPKLAISAAVLANRARIEKLLERAAADAARSSSPAAGVLSEKELDELHRRARQYIPERAAYYAPIVGVSYNRIYIKAQHTRWGSCSGKGNLNFNCLLMLTPADVIDSVVVHELCHLKHMNHSRDFYTEVRRVYPDYDRCSAWLKKNGSAIMSRNPK